MRILVTGAGGMLGTDVVASLRAAGHDVLARSRADLDIAAGPVPPEALGGSALVVNCGAWTAVDDAESAEAQAFTVNAVGAAHLARACAGAGARLVQISTDYVFAGDATTPYAEDAPMAPRSAYGRTKAAGEWAVRAEAPEHWILRTAWLYGAHGPNFAATMARLAGDRDSLSVVDDQIGQPTWTVDVAQLIVALIAADAPTGTYHATSSGRASWFDFARAVVGSAGHDPAMVTPTDSGSFARPAPRPAWSVLGHDGFGAIGVEPIGDWRERWEQAAAVVLGASA
ncbi:dTDP-4-dehydrorhamnose reductase [Occultella glacieicola]|uniref:dTDP-4-dehydrorhamnose reductase n=1 Tax=Occultella glacieicola TaxID=2518684 RepID=A0ABY2E3F1_9MICO|nr:dTDP-4-dehydrorhamnose reductase [Occultella glacieicola]TDE94130.1 dTDP-4-dehydrorhamnose reductase [Occultella glacieicola]